MGYFFWGNGDKYFGKWKNNNPIGIGKISHFELQLKKENKLEDIQKI